LNCFVSLVWCVKGGKKIVLIFLFCCCDAWRNKGKPCSFCCLDDQRNERKTSLIFLVAMHEAMIKKPNWFFCFVVATSVLLLQRCTKGLHYHAFHFASWTSLCIVKL
jgi:hypothetical protein